MVHRKKGNLQKLKAGISRRQKILIATGLILLAIFVLSDFMFITTWIHTEDEEAAFEELAHLAEMDDSTEETSGATNDMETADEQEGSEDNHEEFTEIYERNHDFAGWLSIEDTEVNYPVMLTPDDPDYYLHCDFNKNCSQSGTPFIGEGCTLESDNIILYGHNMSNGTMFHDLIHYVDKSFLEEHPIITFDTLEDSAQYVIIAAFKERVHNQSETNVFRYYSYGGDLTEERFTEYIENIKSHSTYDTGITAEYGDQLITLSTCSYHTTNGRFVVVAKRIS